MKQRKYPAGMTALKTHAHLVREVAMKHKLSWSEEAVPESEDLVRFSFGRLDDAMTRGLFFDIPREAYYFKAVFVEGPPVE